MKEEKSPKYDFNSCDSFKSYIFDVYLYFLSYKDGKKNVL